MPDMEHEQCSKSDIDMIGHRHRGGEQRREVIARSFLRRPSALPGTLRCIGCSSALESSVLPPPAALRRRNCEADHILSARLERTSVSTWRVHTRATRLAGGLTRATSKAAMMNRSERAVRLTCRALTLRRSSPSPIVKESCTVAALQPACVELCAPHCKGARTHMLSMHP